MAEVMGYSPPWLSEGMMAARPDMPGRLYWQTLPAASEARSAALLVGIEPVVDALLATHFPETHGYERSVQTVGAYRRWRVKRRRAVMAVDTDAGPWPSWLTANPAAPQAVYLRATGWLDTSLPTVGRWLGCLMPLMWISLFCFVAPILSGIQTGILAEVTSYSYADNLRLVLLLLNIVVVLFGGKLFADWLRRRVYRHRHDELRDDEDFQEIAADWQGFLRALDQRVAELGLQDCPRPDVPDADDEAVCLLRWQPRPADSRWLHDLRQAVHAAFPAERYEAQEIPTVGESVRIHIRRRRALLQLHLYHGPKPDWLRDAAAPTDLPVGDPDRPVAAVAARFVLDTRKVSVVEASYSLGSFIMMAAAFSGAAIGLVLALLGAAWASQFSPLLGLIVMVVVTTVVIGGMLMLTENLGQRARDFVGNRLRNEHRIDEDFQEIQEDASAFLDRLDQRLADWPTPPSPVRSTHAALDLT